MAQPHLPFSKIVATPTPTSWCQSYAAGGLFLALSLSCTEEEHPEHLGAIGKKIINDLEAEYFALEEKSLTEIQSVIKKSFVNIPSNVSVSAATCVVRDTVLYVFLLGKGSILLSRNGSMGALLQETNTQGSGLQSASGYLENNDLVILQTKEFQAQIPEMTLTSALKSEDIEEVAETLSPLIHGKEDGGSAAIFFRFTSLPATEEEAEEEPLPETLPIAQSETPSPAPFPETEHAFPHPTVSQSRERKKPSLPNITRLYSHLTHRQRLLITIAGLLVFILLISIFFTNKNTNQQKAKEVFAKTYEPAKRYFEEGEALLDLNPTGARDNLEKAKNLVADAEKNLPKGSEEAKKILELKKDINQALSSASGENKASIAPATTSDASKLLLALLLSKDVLFATQDEDNVYALTAKEIIATSKTTTTKKTLIKNDGDWARPAGIGTFLGNLYVLDKDKGILKFVKGSDGYGDSSSYLKGDTPDLSTVVSMAIDSSIYVLFANGDIAKFTKGAPDSFKVSGLPTPFARPTHIYTMPDFSSVYVLDTGNGRIVQLGTNGAYKAQFSAGAIKKATDFEVNEKDKKAYLLIENKIYEMKLE